ncbi:pilus assembly FimT family protein [Shewanella psychrotolerans]|uniref:pilus assembly FimT family protein n=1 Tax=Shewanella psychrotolerans TaxID=2864206 RepID=UPI001C65DFEE|nr:prepilin-type N-terminal cleavage/methylation domain-containing protein [Shewanella psychrotolerans]QYK00081.1 prepilin-type N-terminal cleavage/methylation domain-containing protein [Shewanella psychrotolerans]
MVATPIYSRKSAGLSLIELMVTIVISSIIAMYGSSLTINWLAKQKIKDAEENLAQGYASARALALRTGTNSTNPSAYLLLIDNTLCVQKGSNSNLNCNAPEWIASLPVTSSSITDKTSACIAFNSAGLPKTATLDSISCSVATSYNVALWSNTANGYLE